VNDVQAVPFHEYVIPELVRYLQEGRRAALVTLVDIDGSSPRPLGSQMAVSGEGEALGNITGGCAEAAIVAEAVEAIRAGENRRLRFGEGSPFIDVRLACGAGIEVYINVHLGRDIGEQVAQAVAARTEVTLAQDTATGQTTVVPPAVHDGEAARGAETVFRKRYQPATRVVAIGKGPIVVSLARLARLLDFEVHAMSAEESTLRQVAADCVAATKLTVPSAFQSPQFDPYTAVVLLFHEHEWEPPILKEALMTEGFYIGVLGSRRSHKERIEVLREMGVSEADLDRIRAPVGLDIGAKTPQEIALSVLAEIVRTTRERTAS
jgi:xanthine dehydrogenase accessory factor